MSRAGSRIEIYSRKDDSVHVWNADERKELRKLNCDSGVYINQVITMSGNANHVLALSGMVLCVWDVGSGRTYGKNLSGLSTSVAMSEDGNRVATCFLVD